MLVDEDGLGASFGSPRICAVIKEVPYSSDSPKHTCAVMRSMRVQLSNCRLINLQLHGIPPWPVEGMCNRQYIRMSQALAASSRALLRGLAHCRHLESLWVSLEKPGKAQVTYVLIHVRITTLQIPYDGLLVSLSCKCAIRINLFQRTADTIVCLHGCLMASGSLRGVEMDLRCLEKLQMLHLDCLLPASLLLPQACQLGIAGGSEVRDAAEYIKWSSTTMPKLRVFTSGRPIHLRGAMVLIAYLTDGHKAVCPIVVASLRKTHT